MLTKNEIKYIHSLKLKKNRKQSGEFVAEGVKLILDLLQSGMEVKKLFTTETSLFDAYNDIIIEEITQKELSRLSNQNNPNKAIALFSIPTNHFSEKLLEKDWILALDGINDPGNLGTIIRTADWFGFKHILCSSDCVDAYNPKVVQASMGSLARVQLHYMELQDELPAFAKKTSILGSFMDGESIEEYTFPKNGILLIGNEANGISDEIAAIVHKKLSIPSFSLSQTKAESLNAAVATAIFCYSIKKSFSS